MDSGQSKPSSACLLQGVGGGVQACLSGTIKGLPSPRPPPQLDQVPPTLGHGQPRQGPLMLPMRSSWSLRWSGRGRWLDKSGSWLFRLFMAGKDLLG